MAKSRKEVKSDNREYRRDGAGLFIPAGLFLGFAFGFMYGNLVAYMFGGLGLGFLTFALVKLFRK
ncbi:MAG: hypothetical protein WCL37_04460 [Chrysiogenales bacterium]